MAEQAARGGEKNTDVIREAMRGMIASKPLAKIDYVSVAHGDSLEELARISSGAPVMVSLAVRFGTTRLIDKSPSFSGTMDSNLAVVIMAAGKAPAKNPAIAKVMYTIAERPMVEHVVDLAHDL
jgi:hypothetical protein